MKLLQSNIIKPYLILTRQFSKNCDVAIIGGGHNGLIAAAYLAKSGKKVCLFERRNILGGAAVTEEIFPGFKFSRASYVLGLLRPNIIQDLQLKKHGLKVVARNPNSFTPIHEAYWESNPQKSLTLGAGREKDENELSKFSKNDSKNYAIFQTLLGKYVDALEHLLDINPIDASNLRTNNLSNLLSTFKQVKPLYGTAKKIGKDFPELYQLLTGSTTKILNEWFECEILKATLATDSVIGAFISPSSPGSGYVLLHHLMSQVDGVKEVWGFAIGGMGAVSESIASVARKAGADLNIDSPVQEILLDNGRVEGLKLENGSNIKCSMVLSNATPKVTFIDLLPNGCLPEIFEKQIRNIDYSSPVCKINVALNALPNFKAMPNVETDTPMPHHQSTIHLNCESMDFITEAFVQGSKGDIPDRPLIEMTIPTSVDDTLAPKGCHVALFFTQYVSYTLAGNKPWDDKAKKGYAEKVFRTVEEYAPGFRKSVIDYEVLPPPELERIFGLTGGNIFHGAMSLDQLYFCRPTSSRPSPNTPIKGLFLCGAGAHPGGGVMGAPGRLAANAALTAFKSK